MPSKEPSKAILNNIKQVLSMAKYDSENFDSSVTEQLIKDIERYGKACAEEADRTARIDEQSELERMFDSMRDRIEQLTSALNDGLTIEERMAKFEKNQLTKGDS